MATGNNDITSTHPTDWKYVSEGGATIVFSYVGPSDSSRAKNTAFQGMVLRLRKVPSVPLGVRFDSDSSSFSEDEDDEEDDEDEPDDPSIAFQKQCMARLVPNAHLPQLESIIVRSPPGRSYTSDAIIEEKLDGQDALQDTHDHDEHHHRHHHHKHLTDGSAWLRALAATHDELRPQTRRALGGIDFKRRKGVLATDLVGGHGMSVEIKPKWSFLPNPAHLSAEFKPIKTKTCRFCMHTHMRTQEATSKESVQTEDVEEQKPSSGRHAAPPAVGYCPLDLFSPRSDRVRYAVHALYDAWIASEGKANNLKVFVRGKGVKVSGRKLIFHNPPSELEEDQIRTAFADSLLPLLTQTPVLQLLNRLQRTLDMLDVEGLVKVWEKWCRSSGHVGENELGAGCEEPTLEEWGSFIDSYLHELGLDEQSGKGPAESVNGKAKHAELPDVQTEEEMRFYLLAYLLSATFKDCSIIVRVPLLGSDMSEMEDANLDSRMITLIDLDPKSMTRLKKWEALDREIVSTYGQLREEERTACIDDWN
ncbi:hypothetical protein D9758_000900 [Tetrapyrgos nigripes]|uniref:Inositol-pentakisphosphate 2-kinase n=1 Tax=Tetrapyrgos nigripes TaxID=182062 RepID=A0A8H5GYY3_9AGAR|nr:hypothetical protein D9758_000900 [Tetrapyrgos nigripes]